ncbi:MAG TPA: cbb3-type cytochrome c oxidase subunit I, partial [Chitinophagaceae bacterium]
MMAQSRNNQITFLKLFILAGLLPLTAGMFFGLIGGLQYLIPGFLKDHISFEKVRPLHVSSVVFWIIISAMGGVLTYVQEHNGRKIYSIVLVKIQFALFILSVLLILISYCAGIFSGREYWEYPPVLSLPIIAGWILFLI